MEFGASSWFSNNTIPKFARLYPQNSNGYWKPAESNEDEFLEINLHKSETIYGVELSGNPLNDEYVTSYKIAYGMDGISFSFVLYNGFPEVNLNRGRSKV